ncbi:MAG: hypothetical protein RIC04_15055 [Parvibaculum sp.]|uniref:hypothetical protein n=1 Tax=Parvibaculum sp. TaxID=2024848 RepID=UPI0032ED87F8
MLDRDWLFFISIGGILVFGFASAWLINSMNDGERHYVVAQQQYESAHDRTGPSTAEGLSRINDAKTYREEWRQEQDLDAQREMAKWALMMFFASACGVGVTALGVIYVAQTLVATREAVAAANRTADEAKRIGEAQVRAYMSISNLSIIFAADGDKIVPIVQMKIGNSGNSPARSFEMRMQLAYQTIFFDGTIAQEVILMPENWGPFISKAEQPFSFGFRDGPLGRKYIEEMGQRGWPLGVHVTIHTSFVDVFDIPFKDSQTFTALYGTLEEIYQQSSMTRSQVSIDEMVESARHMTVEYAN